VELRRNLRDARHRVLADLAKAGREDAFRRLYSDLYDPVAAYFARRVQRMEDAEDLTATVFHRFLRELPRYESGRGSVMSWVMTMSRNCLIDFLRRQRPSEALDEIALTLAEPGADPLEQLLVDEEARFAHGLLTDYPLQTREMFSLRFADGLRYSEIASILGISEASVKQRFSRTLRELRDSLETRPSKGGDDHANWKTRENPQGIS
jgi:RNA polymerase sigma-70 factor (ECF subfamily)